VLNESGNTCARRGFVDRAIDLNNTPARRLDTISQPSRIEESAPGSIADASSTSEEKQELGAGCFSKRALSSVENQVGPGLAIRQLN
jgi:nitrous oxidase accessory protein NosD